MITALVNLFLAAFVTAMLYAALCVLAWEW